MLLIERGALSHGVAFYIRPQLCKHVAGLCSGFKIELRQPRGKRGS